MDEFSLIDRLFKPLAQGFSGSLNLTDDAAILSIPAGHELVVTKDAISEGIHFIGNEDAPLIAKKLLRVNLSDLAAMGAKPLSYFLAVMLPKSTTPQWLERFAQGLREDQQAFSIHLAGGDTTTTQGTMSFSITAMGTVPAGAALKRSTAKSGDLIYVSGTLGDSAIGLQSLQNKNIPGLSDADKEFLEQRYALPQPRLELGLALHDIASSCIDISDGLVQDMGHICATSHVAAEIKAQDLPLSEAAAHAIERAPQLGLCVFSGGDDYELLFTVPKEKADAVPHDCTCIGVIKDGNGVTVLDENGKPMGLPSTGYKHFS